MTGICDDPEVQPDTRIKRKGGRKQKYFGALLWGTAEHASKYKFYKLFQLMVDCMDQYKISKKLALWFTVVSGVIGLD